MNVLFIALHHYGADCMQSYACVARLCLPLANARMDCIRSTAMGNQVEMVEVGPRDGLQIDPLILPTTTKIELITRLLAAGLRATRTPVWKSTANKWTTKTGNTAPIWSAII
jgi:hypothetical protein